MIPKHITEKFLLPDNIITIGEVEFHISSGKTVNLEDVIISIIPTEFLKYYSDLKSFLLLDVEHLAIPDDQKNKLKYEIRKISSFPLSINSIILTSQNITFSVDYKTITIGSEI